MRLTLVTNPDKCNLHCPLCFLNQRGCTYGMGEMPWEVAKAAIDRYAGTEKCGDAKIITSGAEGLREVIPSTMGEPLLYSYFNELLEYCGKKRVPLNLTTNGSFPGTWKTEKEMVRLLRACSDIKISCMGFDEATFDEMMPGLGFACWRENVERLCCIRDRLVAENEASSPKRTAMVSLQVTLHRGMVEMARDVLTWAESIGVDRIKWNLPVFLECGESLRTRYGVDKVTAAELRSELRSKKMRSEGSLFFDCRSMISDIAGNERNGFGCAFFKDEIWVMPDGSEQHCPNPERRFGNPEAPGAKCGHCIMFC